MTIEEKATDNNTKVQIRKILVPIDGSECSLNAVNMQQELQKTKMHGYFVFTL